MNTTKILEVLDANSGAIRETQIQHPSKGAPVNLDEVAPYPRDYYGRMSVDPHKLTHLTEASTGGLSTANFPDLLRMGIQFDLFSGYAERPTVYQQIARVVQSNDHQEEYGFDEGIGLPTIVAEGQEYPSVSPTLGGGKIIKNFKRGMLIAVTEEIMKFDKVGKVRDTAGNVGRAFRMGREQSVMNVLTTTGNYNVLNNNDQAANNTQNLTFNADNLNIALGLMMTQKDKKSGQYLGVQADTLIVTPLLEAHARMLISSTMLQRGSSSAEIFGTGANNPFFGVVSKIIVTPLFGATYEWALLDGNRAIRFQEVEPVQVFLENAGVATGSWVNRDVIHYKARDWYGVDMLDDRFAFFSNSTTKPTVA